jgi:subtilase family serine protease
MRRLLSVTVFAVVLATSGVAASSAVAAPSLGGIFNRIFKHACDTPSVGHAACDAIKVTTPTGATPPGQVSPLASPSGVSPAATPAGYGPSDLRSAYNVASAAASNGGNETVAIVDAMDDPNAASDLATYRSTYGLPACGTANNCFRKVSQTGGTSYPSGNSGWGEEISLDLDMVSAICPNCKIILVEASSTSLTNLGTAVNEAAALGATQISNSYGGGESSSETTYSSKYYQHPGIDVTVSSGDDGFGVEFPAASQYVTAVGGTTLTRASNARGWTESAWSDAGSGCSVYIPKPSWQHDVSCARRTVADVSAVADPNTPVAVYDSYGESGWLEFGGTSVASPLIASIDALAGGRSGTTSAPTYGSYAYVNPSQFNDVVGGSNGSCGGNYECTGVAGYDGPTGIGTPNGVGPVGPPPPPPPVPVNNALPTISGSTVQGQTVSSTTGGWTNTPTSYAYQWSNCTTSATSSCTSVSGATGSSYVLPAGVPYVSVAVTATNAGGPSAPAVAASPYGPTTAPPASFTLTASPTSQTVNRSKSASYTISVVGHNGFSGAVSFTASGLSSGITASFSPASSATSTTLTLSSTTAASTGAHTITINGSSGGLSGSTSVNLTLNSCFLGIFC